MSDLENPHEGMLTLAEAAQRIEQGLACTSDEAREALVGRLRSGEVWAIAPQVRRVLWHGRERLEGPRELLPRDWEAIAADRPSRLWTLGDATVCENTPGVVGHDTLHIIGIRVLEVEVLEMLPPKVKERVPRKRAPGAGRLPNANWRRAGIEISRRATKECWTKTNTNKERLSDAFVKYFGALDEYFDRGTVAPYAAEVWESLPD